MRIARIIFAPTTTSIFSSRAVPTRAPPKRKPPALRDFERDATAIPYQFQRVIGHASRFTVNYTTSNSINTGPVLPTINAEVDRRNYADLACRRCLSRRRPLLLRARAVCKRSGAHQTSDTGCRAGLSHPISQRPR